MTDRVRHWLLEKLRPLYYRLCFRCVADANEWIACTHTELNALSSTIFGCLFHKKNKPSGAQHYCSAYRWPGLLENRNRSRKPI